jgi:hypothetical protein
MRLATTSMGQRAVNYLSPSSMFDFCLYSDEEFAIQISLLSAGIALHRRLRSATSSQCVSLPLARYRLYHRCLRFSRLMPASLPPSTLLPHYHTTTRISELALEGTLLSALSVTTLASVARRPSSTLWRTLWSASITSCWKLDIEACSHGSSRPESSPRP